MNSLKSFLENFPLPRSFAEIVITEEGEVPPIDSFIDPTLFPETCGFEDGDKLVPRATDGVARTDETVNYT